KISTPSAAITAEEADRLLQDGLAVQGQLRTLSRSIAYVEHPLDKQRVLVFGTNRLHAMHGDMVVVRVFPIGHWKVAGTESVDLFELQDRASDTMLAEEEDSLVGTPELAAPQDENLEAEFTDLPPLVPVDNLPISKTLDRIPSRYHHLFSCKSLFELAADPLRSSWPTELPENLNLFDPLSTFTPLPSSRLLRTGQVVAILRKNPRSRRLLGQIAFFRASTGRITRSTVPINHDEPSVDGAICLFVPNSTNQSLIKLDPASVPKAILENRALGLNTNHVCIITGWNNRMNIPCGVILEQLGDMNQLEPATKQILLEYGLEDKEFLPEHLNGLPKSPSDFVIPSSEYLHRRDFRSCCIISIDPASAKDVDDALHIKCLGSVPFSHSSGSNFCRSPREVIPMLPAILSEHLCSLQPAVDRLAFSVVMKVRASGDILDTWIGRTIIRSRAKLSYDHALALLETASLHADDEKVKALAKLIPTPEAPFNLMHVRDSLIQLNSIARNLRKERIQNGALTLQKAKIEFDLPSTVFDTDTTDIGNSSLSDSNAQGVSTQSDRTIWPRGYSIQAPGPSHQLIEEWMLAANQVVARRLFEAFQRRNNLKTVENGNQTTAVSTPNSGRVLDDGWSSVLLRRHSAPSERNIAELTKLLETGGIQLQDGSSKALSSALRDHNQHLKDSGRPDEERAAIMDALSHLVYVRMKMATYFSLDDVIKLEPDLLSIAKTEPERVFEYTWHYGLNVPLYTHFTSPIRRYADLLVHRQLASILRLEQPSSEVKSGIEKGFKARRTATNRPSLSQLTLQADWCNHRRMMSRRAQEASQRLFLTACLRDCGPMQMDATVITLSPTSVKLLLSAFGIVVACPLKQFLRHTLKWEVIVGDAERVSRTEEPEVRKQEKSISHIFVQWTAHVKPDSVEPETLSREIHVLSVLPCRVCCQSDRLNLHAEFIPPEASESAAVNHSDVSP
ncbi:DIS3-like exonuclease 2, partial [Paragonimus westermani]